MRENQIVRFALSFLRSNLDDAIQDTSYDFTEQEIEQLEAKFMVNIESLEDLTRLTEDELFAFFSANAKYSEDSPPEYQYQLRVGRTNLYAGDTAELKDKFFNYVKSVSLNETRKDWEKKLTPIAENFRDEGTYLVVLEDKNGRFNCHRYFTIGNEWTVSVDRSGVDMREALQWSMNPKAKCQYEE